MIITPYEEPIGGADFKTIFIVANIVRYYSAEQGQKIHGTLLLFLKAAVISSLIFSIIDVSGPGVSRKGFPKAS